MLHTPYCRFFASYTLSYNVTSKYDASVEKEKAAKAKGKDNGINAISNTEPEQSVRGWEQGRMCVFVNRYVAWYAQNNAAWYAQLGAFEHTPAVPPRA